MLVRKSRLTACLIIMLMGATNILPAQTSAVTETRKDLASTPLESVRIKAQGVEGVFSDLSLSYNIPIGLEIASNDDELAYHKIDFKKGALSELLAQFVTQHEEYMWEIKDGVVHIFPKAAYRDFILTGLLETEISSFSIKENTGCWNMIDSLLATPEATSFIKALY